MEGNQPTREPSTSPGGSLGTRTHRSSPDGANDGGDEESESESEESPSTALKNFRKEWEAELKQISTSNGDGNSGNGSGTSSGKRKHNTPITKPTNANHSSTTSQFFALSPAASSSFAPTPKKESNSQSPLPQSSKSSSGVVESNNSEEEEAKRLFLMGVSFERRGDLYDAVRYYRRAMQLVPDIEKRVMAQTESETETPTDSNLHSPGEGSDSDDNNEEDEGPLSVRFLQSIQENGVELFQKAVHDTKVHFNDFPVELLLYILRWVISDELDVRSLDILSSTSKGFYCLCRDDQLWKLACDRVWSASSLVDSRFLSYRDMFLSRPRVRYDGCYISRVTYVRPGEHSFQDQSYRPWHMVEYFRYIRFFPDGKIYFLTTAERPSATVSSLRDRDSRNPGTLRGTYRLYGNNLISATLTKSSSPSAQIQQGHRKSRAQTNDTTTFHMDFEIEELKNKSNWVLRWTYYAVYINNSNTRANNRNNNNNQNNNLNLNINNPGGGITSTFELTPNKYPPLYFSRVKSYTSRSENILE